MSDIIVLSNISAQQAVDYKKQLDIDGLVTDQDYTWSYRPVKYNGWAPVDQSEVEFEFTDPALASFYRLKWAK